MTPEFQALEVENSRLRAELVDLRSDYREEVKKFAQVAGMIGFEPDQPVGEIERVIAVKLANVPALEQASVQAAAKWIERYCYGLLKVWTGEMIVGENSWTEFAVEAQSLIQVIRRRESGKAGQ